jgi:ribose 5-phosphate isomerase A
VALSSSQFQRAAAEVAEHAATLIQPGMRLGLGTGRMATAFLEALRPRIAAGLKIRGLCSSKATEERARSIGVELLAGSGLPLDLDIDGADEFDPRLNLLKGGHGALLRETLVAERSRRFWVLADPSKAVQRLCSRNPLPVEVLPFDWEGVAASCQERLPCRCQLRGGVADPFVTDNGNYLLHLEFPGGLTDPGEAAARLSAIAGVLGHGLFLGKATAALVSEGHGIQVVGDLEAEREI